MQGYCHPSVHDTSAQNSGSDTRNVANANVAACVLVNQFGKYMKRILAAVLLFILSLNPVLATPMYAGLQVDDNTAGVLFGFRINNAYAVEAHYSKSHSSNSYAGITVDTSKIGVGVAGLAMFPMKLNDVLPYNLFLKVGFEHTSSTDTYSIPDSVTLTLPYSGSIDSTKNQALFGGGAEYDFSKNLLGRMGIDFQGKNRSVNLSAIFKF
jgi:hypothetical protein